MGLGMGKLYSQFPDICLLPQVFANCKKLVFFLEIQFLGGTVANHFDLCFISIRKTKRNRVSPQRFGELVDSLGEMALGFLNHLVSLKKALLKPLEVQVHYLFECFFFP